MLLADSAEAELAEYLVADALENLVAAFDGFGREVCSQKGADIHFQNLDGARRRVKQAFGFDFADGLACEEWDSICRMFQKRHLLAHKMGVVDAEYLNKVNDSSAVIGRKIRITGDEVTAAMNLIEPLGRRLFQQVFDPQS